MKVKLLAAISAAVLLAAPAIAQQKSVKIGYVTTLSGPTAVIGEDMKNSVELALDHLGRKMGGLPVEIIYEDDAQKPDVGKQKTDKLVTQDKVPFVAGYIWSNVLLASYQAAADSGAFVLSSNAGPSQIAGEGCHKNFFAVSWQNDQTPMALGQTLNTKGVKKLYIMSPNYAAGRDMAAGVKRTFKGEVVGEDYTKWPGQLDFSAELAKVRASGAEALFVFYPGPAGVQILTQYDQAGLRGKVPLYTVYTIDALSLPAQKDAAIGIPGTQEWVNDLPNDANKKFVADFKKKHGTYPSFYGAQAYDTIMLIASAVEAVKGDLTKTDAIRAALQKANFKSVRGPFKFGNNHFPIQNFYLQDVVKDSEGKLTLKTVATVLTAHQDPFASQCTLK